MTLTWAILSGEYPPGGGGVADHVQQVASALAQAGDNVHVFIPARDASPPRDEGVCNEGVTVHELRQGFVLAGLPELGARLNRLPGSARILVQYTPQTFGCRSMNLPLCLWLRARRRGRLIVMFHEVMQPISSHQPWRHNLLGLTHRSMARHLVWHAARALVSTPQWEPILREQCHATCPIDWCPVPGNLPKGASPESVARLRAQMRNDGELLIGHFGTYSAHVTNMLEPVLIRVLGAEPKRRALLVGRGSERFREKIIAAHPRLVARIAATGALPSCSAAEHLAACDLLVQPYPDGITFRRSSFMSGLGLGLSMVTNLGPLSESMWRDQRDAVEIACEPTTLSICYAVEKLARDEPRRLRMRKLARELHDSKFSLARAIDILRKDHGDRSRA